MGRTDDYRAELGRLPRAAWAGFLRANSGLPGPRGNLELIAAVADVGQRRDFDELIATDEEYLTACGTVGLGAVLAGSQLAGSQLAGADDPALVDRLHALASDSRWRVREAVAMAVQRLGDAAPERMFALVERWVEDRDPLVVRAAVAGVCEPRLLRPAGAAARAVAVCERATVSIVDRPVGERRLDGVRTLRKALGYAWSVAVAADPAAGLPRFLALEASTDPDVAWIVRENRKKARLVRLLG